MIRASDHGWDSASTLELVREAGSRRSRFVHADSLQRFDVLPLLATTDGTIAYMGILGRRLRPNIVAARWKDWQSASGPGGACVAGRW
jgi:hypothetical protein